MIADIKGDRSINHDISTPTIWKSNERRLEIDASGSRRRWHLQPKYLLIRLGEQLDISSTHLFLWVGRLLRARPLEKIVIDLAATVRIQDSGLALLLLLHEQAGPVQERIYLVNCNLAIRERITTTCIASRFHLR